MSANLRSRWLAEVTRSKRITDSTRVVLLVLADNMTAAGYVSVPRAQLAGRTGRSPRRITDRLEKAKDAGFLAVVRSGQPGRTAEYVAVIPALSHGADGRTMQGGGRVHHAHGAESGNKSVRTGAPSKTDTHGADGGPANTRTRSNQSPFVTQLPSNHATATDNDNADGPHFLMRPSDPMPNDTGGTYKEQQPTRVRNSTTEDEEDTELYAVGGAT